MAGIACNIAKGREVEFYERVNANDPANSALIMLLLQTGGDSLQTLQDYDTLSALLAGPSNEVSVAGYARKTLTDADLAAWTPDDTLNRVLLTLPLQTFAALTTGQTVDHVVVAYDSDTTGGTDANIVPITVSEVRVEGSAVATNGAGIQIDFSSGWVAAV